MKNTRYIYIVFMMLKFYILNWNFLNGNTLAECIVVVSLVTYNT